MSGLQVKKNALSHLPEPSHFKNKLSGQYISDDDYAYARSIWHRFGMSSFKHYHDIYLTTDVVLLADVFEKFCLTSLQHFSLDPSHSITLPAFGWQCMLKQTGVELDYVYDVDMHIMFEKGIRGGISSIMKRSASANNHYLHNFDETREQSYISYIDMNSLYPHAMKDALPYSDFRWESEQVDFMNIADDAERGYILEVDLAYPADLHHSHNQ